jgi:superfamily II DNA/RNA helicase/cold shock CspA family protein
MSTTFAELGVPADLVSTLHARGVHAPFPIQTLTVADGCAGRDLSGRAPTGSGKTIAFGIPLAARIGHAEPHHPRALVLVPTRELAAQVCGELAWLGRGRKLRVASVYGGTGFGNQLKALRRGVDILVACPGRLTDLIERGDVDLDAAEMVVVDEADRMADMGFLPVVRRLLDRTPASRQTLLFSATLDGAVDTLIRRYQRNPVRHLLPEAPLLAEHLFWKAERDDRVQLTADVIRAAGPTIVFCRTKHGTDQLAKRLARIGVRVEAIHGNRSQGQRERALAAFSDGKVDALAATDVAARGIHVDDVACVLHFDPPNDAKDYTHRSGRTARAGASGVVVSLVGRDQARAVAGMQRALGFRPGVVSVTTDALASLRPDARRQPVPTAAVPTPAASDPGSDSPSGSIKWFDARKGFGFIEQRHGDDLFVHVSAIAGGGHQRLEEGQQVEFEIGPGRKGDEARNVRVLVS